MSRYEFRLPDIGEGVTEGEIVGWLVKAGDRVTENQDMVEVMTDKATVTIGAPKDGRVVELRGNVGDTIPVGEVVVVLGLGDDDAEVEPPAPSPPAPAAPAAAHQAVADDGPVASAVGDIRTSLPGIQEMASASRPAPTSGSASASPAAGSAMGPVTDRPLAAPATRKLARELGIDLRQVVPTGKGGRVTREDVAVAQSRRSEPPRERVLGVAQSPGVLQERQPIRGIRKRIYENMARSKRTAAHFTYVDECEVSRLVDLRQRLMGHSERRAGIKLTYLPFIIKAVVVALRKHPKLNCLVDDATQELVLRSDFDIGIAVSTDAGLIVPVLRGADRRSMAEIAAEIERLSSAARAGKTAPEDLGGSSFTITSLGRLGGLFATPVINYPEVAILGVHEIKQRPVVKDGAIVVGSVMHLSLSFDHRVIDGHVGAAFAREIVELLEEPERLMLEA